MEEEQLCEAIPNLAAPCGYIFPFAFFKQDTSPQILYKLVIAWSLATSGYRWPPTQYLEQVAMQDRGITWNRRKWQRKLTIFTSAQLFRIIRVALNPFISISAAVKHQTHWIQIYMQSFRVLGGSSLSLYTVSTIVMPNKRDPQLGWRVVWYWFSCCLLGQQKEVLVGSYSICRQSLTCDWSLTESLKF